MTRYTVIPRRYRPQSFHEVLGQDPIITTLRNSLIYNRLAQSYLFSGSHGTGKTTLARVLAKALNCKKITPEGEPCNHCPSCIEIAGGYSLDVLEIDGASHRGIDDVRQINETIGYTGALGGYKIYIIDEVHMLTKDAFNALLKTLEEPPPHVKFFFATTEPHRVPLTILSRCQCFQLRRIPSKLIENKLANIVQDLDREIEPEALNLIALRADGGLRDAESLLDQILSCHKDKITAEDVATSLGIVTRDLLYRLDLIGSKGDLASVFEITEELFRSGKDLNHFLDSLIEHFRNIALFAAYKPKIPPYLEIGEKDKEKYLLSSSYYKKEQIIELLEELIKLRLELRSQPLDRIDIEAILLKIIRSHQCLTAEYLISKLTELEKQIHSTPFELHSSSMQAAKTPPSAECKPLNEIPKATEQIQPAASKEKESLNKTLTLKPLPSSRYDTLMQFAAVELEGTIQKRP